MEHFHIQFPKTSLNKFNKIEIISSIFSDYYGMKLEIKINYRKKSGKITNTWRLNNMFLNKQWVKEEVKEEVKHFLRQMKMNIQPYKMYRMQQKQL